MSSWLERLMTGRVRGGQANRAGAWRWHRAGRAALVLAVGLWLSSLTSAETPVPRLSRLMPNTATDLGRYECRQPADNPEGCDGITDYGRFNYDAANHQLLMFGGGYATTHRTDVDVFDLRTLTWKSAYPSTPCSALRLGNVDTERGAWRSTGHPIARHTHDMAVVVDRPTRLLLLNAPELQGHCVESVPPGEAERYRVEGRIASYDPATKRWTYSSASTRGWEGTAAADWDPISRKVVVIDGHFLWTYDPDTQVKTQQLTHNTSALSYSKNLVYFPPNQKMYYIADGEAVFEVTLDRRDFARSTIVRVGGITGDIPRLRETGFAYDPVHRAIGGGVREGIFYAYYPMTRAWASRRIQPDGAGGNVGTVAFHALEYDPVSNVFIFLTDYRSGRHTWAFRFSDEQGTNVRAAGVPSWPGSSVCPSGSLLRVGPTRQLRLPSWAARCAHDGDTIEIDAATYEGDVAVWTANHLTVRGVGGRPHLKAAGEDAEGKAIWVIRGRTTTVENMEFSGATVPDGNGAAIRQEGPNLTVRNCYFHHSETGILTGANPDSEIVIEGSEFSEHGSPDGRNHNIYIGAVRRFTLRYSYVHHARIGHNVKSRARENFILYNRIMDERDGTASYAVDIPNGGLAYVVGNIIQHGPHAENPTIVSYGAEGLKYGENQFYAVNNTVVNDQLRAGVFIELRGTPDPVQLINNIFAGGGTVLSGRGELKHNLAAAEPRFRSRGDFDYRLERTSPAIDGGMDPGHANGFSLAPTEQYVHKSSHEPRPVAGRIDIGAYEYVPPRSE